MFPSHATSVHGGASTPSGWQLSPLGEVATFQRGFDLPTRQRHSGPIPVVSSAGITDHHDTSMVASPGVITGRYGTIGELFYVTTPFWPLNTTLFVRDFHGNDPRFVYYALHRFGFKTFSGKSGVPGVNRNELHREAVAIPIDVGEQRAIADALGDMDALLDALDRQIAKQHDLKQAAMQQLLTGRTRLPGFTGEWQHKSLRDIVSTPITDGPHLTPKFLERGIPFLSVNNLVDNKLDFTDLRFVSREDHEEFAKKCRPQRGDILFGKAASVGQVALINTDRELNIWSPLALIRPGKSSLPQFVVFALQTRDVHRQIGLLTNSSSQGNIGMGEIGQIAIPIPEQAEQTAIAAVLSDMDAELAALAARRAKTRDLKQAMLQELLTGHTRLV